MQVDTDDIRSIKVTKLSHLDIIFIDGEDSEKFLQSVLVCDVKKITDCFVQFSCVCNRKGRVIANFFIFKQKNSFYLILNKSISELFIKFLSKYFVFYKLKCRSIGDMFEFFGRIYPEHTPSSHLEVIVQDSGFKIKFYGIRSRELIISKKILKNATNYLNVQTPNLILEPNYGTQRMHMQGCC